MVKLILFIFLGLCPVLDTLAFDMATNVATSDEMAMHKSNNKQLDLLNEEIVNLSSKVAKYKKCTSKNYVYIGKLSPDADSDGCYNLIGNASAAPASMGPKFAGFITKAGVADKVGFYTAGGASTYRSDLLGRFSADKVCNSIYSNSRAMVYEDIKYIINDLIAPGNITSTPIWVYDAIESLKNRSSLLMLTKYGSTTSAKNNQCNGFNGTSNQLDRAIVLDTVDNNSNKVLLLKEQECLKQAYIACVRK